MWWSSYLRQGSSSCKRVAVRARNQLFLSGGEYKLCSPLSSNVSLQGSSIHSSNSSSSSSNSSSSNSSVRGLNGGERVMVPPQQGLRCFQSEAFQADYVHRPYLSNREKEIIGKYEHSAREYLQKWEEGDLVLSKRYQRNHELGEGEEAAGEEDVSKMIEAQASAVVRQGQLVDRTVPVLNKSLESVGELTLPGLIYDQPLRKDILHRVVVWQRANWRQGTVKVKTRSEVRGGGRKPWPQKGTGRARAGSIRSPLFRGGGKAHGPRPKDWSQRLNSKVRRLGLRVGVSSKLASGQMTVMDELRIDNEKPKTREILDVLNQFGHSRLSFLLVDDPSDLKWEDYEPFDALTGGRKSHWQWRANIVRSIKKDQKQTCPDFQKLQLSVRNLKKRVKVVPPEGLNVYDMLAFDRLIMTPRAIQAITYRLTHPPPRFY